MSPKLEQADAALAVWRDRLAAASRNISELSELPEYGLAKQAASGTGRLAAEARHLVATMDELWQGVLLIGAALDAAERARRGGNRLWRGEEAAQQALDILTRPGITVALADTPVLHRRLLAGPHATTTVSADTLLHTMDAAFDRARDSLARITTAAQDAAALACQLRTAADAVPGAALAARVAAAAALPDALDALDALTALRPEVLAAAAAAAGLAAARHALAALQTAAAQAEAAAASCRAAVALAWPAQDQGALADLGAWLDRLDQTLRQGRVAAAQAGLASWQLLHDRLQAEAAALRTAAQAALARRDELAARLGALRVRHRTRPSTAALDTLAAAARDSLARTPVVLDDAERAVAAYGAALVQPLVQG